MSEMEGMVLSKCLGFGSDGTSVMMGRQSGVATRVKERGPSVESLLFVIFQRCVISQDI